MMPTSTRNAMNSMTLPLQSSIQFLEVLNPLIPSLCVFQQNWINSIVDGLSPSDRATMRATLCEYAVAYSRIPATSRAPTTPRYAGAAIRLGNPSTR